MKLLRRKLGDLSAYLFILPAFIILGLFLIFPVAWSVVASFKDIKPIALQNSGLFEIPGAFVGFDHYVAALSNPLFIKAIVNTTYFAIIFIPITMFGSVILALLVNQKLPGVSFVRSIFFVPYIFSIVSASLVFMFLFNGDRGLINALLMKIGLDGPNWLASTLWAMPVIAIMSCWRNIGYFMIIYLSGLQNIPKDLYEVADVEGATAVQKFRYVTWPLLGRISLVVMILLLINSLNVFQEIYIMTGGGPADSTVTVPFLIFNRAFKYYEIGPAAAMSYILFVIVVIITIIQRKVVAKRLG
ncbi:carbohydrate ABC transporter permease [Paenibacillus apiarius]|uniref:Sugar ABC transporter permease n=1 Tax=Paenibacillus apiarius TaxID=46240 RepID=A0ABT4E1R6_9BACL|nr:sugar ABC transporter permease [Paenibacillus apiarius]MCY9517453.1 sugar ABC transporter permease [Paenibacillus apiarius]MCY9522268.1 sugar ABC transporter permease [Paenibacillus apiarius]MCY9552302.1 sugar ABC transporter permease [Paenibacillus apiarius]MCY9560181.1 sugar ABC transporter permease [Paenibacillus apiarius]MCY9683799.1 sugar ABC transporter permease [Paenibacillus apiarius]